MTKDILDPDRFWVDELSRANKDRLFGCSVGAIDTSRNDQDNDVDVQGLITNHAYSVLRAVECKGKRFVVIRNPWGKTEWTGPWSDGSKEWTAEWLEVLPELGHSFGDDGQFVMECEFFCFWFSVGLFLMALQIRISWRPGQMLTEPFCLTLRGL